MPGMPSLWMSCCCFGVISRFSQTKPLRDDRRVRASAVVEVRQRRGQKFDRLVLVDDAPGLAEQARRLDVGGEHLAVAVDDIGPRGRNRVLRAGAARAVAVGADREHDKTSGQHRIDRREQQDGQSYPGPGFFGAIDVAPVEQAADQPLPPRLRRPLDVGERPAGHC